MATKKPEVKADLPVPRPKMELGAVSPEWQRELEAEAVSSAAQEPAQGKYLSLRGGVMSYQGKAIPNSRMNFIILDGIMEHQLYTKPYDANNPASPDCYAFGRTADSMKPAVQVEKPCSSNCPTCPKFAWGSDPKGGRGKACREVRRIALIDAGVLDSGPEGILAAEIVMCKIPGMSVAPWSDYVRQLANVMKVPTWAVVTDFAVRPDPKSMLMCSFQFVKGITEEQGKAIAEKRRLMGDLLFTPYPPNAEGTPPQQPRKDARY